MNRLKRGLSGGLRISRIFAILRRMNSTQEQIRRLCERYCAVRQIALTTLAKQAVGSSTFFDRLEIGRVTLRSVDRLIHFVSRVWPDEITWPTDIPRPSPDAAPNSPAGGQGLASLSSAPAPLVAGEGPSTARPAASLKRTHRGARSRRKAAASAGRAAPTEAA